MKKDKEIEELNRKLRDKESQMFNLNVRIMAAAEREEEAEKRVDEEKRKYADLLERYISMMERVVKLNEQREAD